MNSEAMKIISDAQDKLIELASADVSDEVKQSSALGAVAIYILLQELVSSSELVMKLSEENKQLYDEKSSWLEKETAQMKADAVSMKRQLDVANIDDPLEKEHEMIRYLGLQKKDDLVVFELLDRALSSDVPFSAIAEKNRIPNHRPPLPPEESSRTVRTYLDSDSNVSEAARRLGIDRKTLRDRMKAYIGNNWKENLKEEIVRNVFLDGGKE